MAARDVLRLASNSATTYAVTADRMMTGIWLAAAGPSRSTTSKIEKTRSRNAAAVSAAHTDGHGWHCPQAGQWRQQHADRAAEEDRPGTQGHSGRRQATPPYATPLQTSSSSSAATDHRSGAVANSSNVASPDLPTSAGERPLASAYTAAEAPTNAPASRVACTGRVEVAAALRRPIAHTRCVPAERTRPAAPPKADRRHPGFQGLAVPACSDSFGGASPM